jgi:aspartokinase-like uncharacterized kinase
VSPTAPLVVVKVGGGLSAHPGALEAVCGALTAAARRNRVLVVPGGGPFADAVRAFDEQHALGADAAHWMAILAMNQYAHVLAARIPGAVLIEEPGMVHRATSPSGIAVLAPYRWLHAADVLPHTWQATSDSAAAFVAGALDAVRLVLIKPTDAPAEALVDPCFASVIPAGLCWDVLGWRQVSRLESLLTRF